ncbi:hypothetical protein RclHR1_00630003 [Rhizophagus clarus]|uniref:Uncharacterized protein n=1 Tax=Rhizophagus clarus TaxID=94130 RepID=A0A2Z6RRL6_9GLOM|nr:hypothetical protein RclHR1_00630003 [Rhizophagus clarus]GES83128.1 hypothetical protein GLOIN_2v1521223 [Rhizophagus clarus]
MSKRTSRACVFIDSSNPSMPSTVINGAQPFIRPPFPPAIKPEDLLRRSKDGSMSKPPNAFIIYRKWFIETARSDGYFLPMTVISSMASQSWDQESEIVKAEYKRLGKEAFNLRNDMLPRNNKRRKREKWNIVKFDEEVKLELNLKKAKSKSPSEKISGNQYPLSPPESLSTESSPTSSPMISPDKESAHLMIPSPIRSTFDENLQDGTDGPTELNHWLSSSESSSISSPENNDQYLLDLDSSDSTPTFDLFNINVNNIGLMLDPRQHSSSYLNELDINTDNSLYEISPKYTFNISQDFETSENYYYMYLEKTN